MKQATLRLDIVSAEKQIFTGEVTKVFVTGEMGEIGIEPGHAQLLTVLKPGYVRAITADNQEQLFYVSGGMLEVQPYIVTVLADTAVRATDLDEAAAIAAQEKAKKVLAGKVSAIDFARANAELAELAAQLSIIARIKKQANIK